MSDDSDLYDEVEYVTGAYVESATHVPSTEAIRATYATDYYMVTVRGGATVTGRAAAFDRWLAARDRAAGAAALEEAAKDLWAPMARGVEIESLPNGNTGIAQWLWARANPEPLSVSHGNDTSKDASA